MNRSGLSTHPWGTPVFIIVASEELLMNLNVCGLSVRKSNYQLRSWGANAYCAELIHLVLGD